jgi:D-alanyl-D-alanine dipeptidase
MKRLHRLLSLWLLVAPCGAQIPPGSQQLLVVTTPEWSQLQGTAQRYQRRHGEFRKLGEPFSIVVGKTGLGWGRGLTTAAANEEPAKREGDGRAPAGIFLLGTAFGYASAVDTRLTYLPLSSGIECVDDVNSRHYNELVDNRTVAKDWSSSERMHRDDILYKYGIVVLHNTPASAGFGSCIFLHVWRNADTGTVGCTAMTEANILILLKWLDPAKNPTLVQLPAAVYQQYRSRWSLPPL